MILNNPALYLTFLGDDLQPGHSTSQTVSCDYIVNRSVKLKKQLLNGLKSSSNQITLQVAKDSASIEDILATEGDIQAVLQDGTAVLFTGYLSTNHSWSVDQNGKQALNLTIEDVGTKLMGKTFIENGHHFFNTTVHNVLQVVCNKAGVVISPNCPVITDTVTKTVDNGKTCKEIIDQLLYEVGYVYYFNNLGQLSVFKIDCTTVEDLDVLDKDDLYIVGGKAIGVSKKIRQYRSARVSFTSLGNASNFLVYRLTTGQDDQHPYCNMELTGLQWFDGLEIYSNAEWEEQTADEFRIPAVVEACNAASEQEKVASNKIIAVSNVSVQAETDSGITRSIISAGGPYLQITAHNTTTGSKYIRRLDAYADVIYEKNINVVRTNVQAQETETSDNLIDETLEFVHTKELAQKHANLVAQYYKYCNTQYQFYSKTEIPLGKVITLYDNVYSGLKVNVMVTACQDSDDSSIYNYSAVGISVFDLEEDCFNQQISDRQPTPPRGADGKDAKAIYQYAIGDDTLYPEDIEYGYAEDENYGYDNNFVYGYSVWTDSPPATEDIPDGKYLWLRISLDDGATWEYMRVSGNKGEKITSTRTYYALSNSATTEPTGTWTIDVDGWYKGKYVWQKVLQVYEGGSATWTDPVYNKTLTDQLLSSVKLVCVSVLAKAYEMNKRSANPERVYLAITVSGYQSNTPVSSWFTITGGTVLYDSQRGSWYVQPSAASFTLTMTEPTTGDFTILQAEGIDVTEYSYYNGPVKNAQELAVIDAGYKVEGDYFLCAQSFGTYLAGNPYVWNGTAWAVLTLGTGGQNENEYANIMAHCIDDAIKCTAVTNTKFFSFFENLGANTAFIRHLMVYYLSIGSGTPTSGFYMRILDGNPPTIIATYDGNEIWKIDATTGKMYGNFAKVLQYLPFNFDDSLDSSHPFECEFYIPDSAEIKTLKLNARGQAYRAYSKTAKITGEVASQKQTQPWSWLAPQVYIPPVGGGYLGPDTGSATLDIPTGGTTKARTTDWQGEGVHSHSLQYTYNNYTTESGGSDYHNHGISYQYIPSGIQQGGSHGHALTLTTEQKTHKHSLPNNLGQSGTYEIQNTTHEHMVNISHEHELEFGIYEGTRPAGVYMYIDNGSGYGSGINLGSAETLANNLNITQYVSGTGWKKLKFTSTRLGRITVQLIAELLVTT